MPVVVHSLALFNVSTIFLYNLQIMFRIPLPLVKSIYCLYLSFTFTYICTYIFIGIYKNWKSPIKNCANYFILTNNFRHLNCRVGTRKLCNFELWGSRCRLSDYNSDADLKNLLNWKLINAWIISSKFFNDINLIIAIH